MCEEKYNLEGSKPKNPYFWNILLKLKNKNRKFLKKLNYDLLDIRDFMEKSRGFLGEEFDDIHIYVMALEDRRFLIHGGVDFIAVARELCKCIFGKKYGGASTIDMQMVRTITGFKEKTFKRKIYEMILSYFVNIKYTKKQIINCYLENAFFGSSLIGIEKVVCKVFKKKSLHDLTKEEKARIAAMLQRPRPLVPTKEWEEKLKDRAFYAESIRTRVKSSNKFPSSSGL